MVRECHKKRASGYSDPRAQCRPFCIGCFGVTHPSIYIPWFFAKKSAQLKKVLEKWKEYDGSIVVYESKYKIDKTLLSVEEIFRTGPIHCLARELTKSHESILSGPVNEVAQKQLLMSGKGEFTLVIAPSGYSFA